MLFSTFFGSYNKKSLSCYFFIEHNLVVLNNELWA